MKDEFKRSRILGAWDLGRKKDSKKIRNRLARRRLRRASEQRVRNP